MNRDYSNVVKSWPGSMTWFTNDSRICDINSSSSGVPNISTIQFDPTQPSEIIPSDWDHISLTCTYPIDKVTLLEQVDNFAFVYGDQDPDNVLILHGYCKNTPDDIYRRCDGIEKTLCDTFPFHPDCILNTQATSSWCWVYTVLIMVLVVVLGYMISGPSTK